MSSLRDGIVCVDIGTTSLRVLLFDADGVVRHTAQRPCAPDYRDHGCVEQDARRWQAARSSRSCGLAT
jgi:sugar (pentulose or hexulose) kinase